MRKGGGKSKGASFEREILANFWAKVRKGMPDDCWLWLAALNNRGYGRFWNGYALVYAHRFAWETENKRSAKALNVLHKCDTPRCVNPKHLWCGTQNDNIQDCIKKGRFRGGVFRVRFKGTQLHNAKLDETKVKQIRDLYAQGMTFLTLGKQFGVSAGTIKAAAERKTWKHVP